MADAEEPTVEGGDESQDASAAEAEDPKINFEPVVKLVAGSAEIKTHEEDEDVLFKM